MATKKKRIKLRKKAPGRVYLRYSNAFLLLIVVMFVCIGWIILQSSNKQLSNSTVNNNPSQTYPRISPTSVVGTTSTYPQFYYLQIQWKNPSLPEQVRYDGLTNYLGTLFNNRDFGGAALVVLDPDNNISKKIPDHFYILFTREDAQRWGRDIPKVETPHTYTNADGIVTISKADADLIPYVNSENYCQTDSDCVLRNICDRKYAQNRYERYNPDLACSIPTPGVAYQGVKCLSNTCTAY